MTEKGKLTVEKLIDDASFIHWVRGTDEKAIRYWNQWTTDHPEDREVIKRAKLIVEGVRVRPQFLTRKEVARKWDQMEEMLVADKSNRVFSGKNIVRIAAAFLVLVFVSIYGYHYYWNTEIVYATDYGERKTVQLSDGTSIELNAHSEIRFIRKKPRKIHMEGEVFFDVQKDAKGTRFEVHTPDLGIEVLGTAFNVNTRQEKTSVMLERGMVQLKIREYGDVSMKPGDFVTYSLRNQEITRKANVTAENYTSWKNGILMLENVTIREALRMLEETYGVEVECKDTTMLERTMKGGIPSDDLNLSLEILRKTYGINIEYNENKLIIR